ncbi:MAG: hypothetical protein P1P76_12510 [Anaerolineales bacterium]|nr:hypothetical protein [Anaerolineales bacterium]
MYSRILLRVGWLLFALGWIPFTGIFIGLIGFPEGSYDWAELPTLTRYSMIATGITFGFAMLSIFSSPLLSWLTNRRVLKEGQVADAKVLEMWDTGTTINENPMVGFRLEVHPISGAPFTADTERLVSRLRAHAIQPGTMVKVRYDPESKEVALLEEDL